MITLKTLEQATAQEVFDQAAEHLLTQNKQSEGVHNNGLTCMYRSPDGLKCAAGCLIGDDEYSREWERRSWGFVSRVGFGVKKHIDLISSLQSIHDDYEPYQWLAQLKELANSEELNTKVLEKYLHTENIEEKYESTIQH
jgi:hypothetical protein